MQVLLCLASELLTDMLSTIQSTFYYIYFDCLWKILIFNQIPSALQKVFQTPSPLCVTKEYALESTVAYTVARLLLFKTNQPTNQFAIQKQICVRYTTYNHDFHQLVESVSKAAALEENQDLKEKNYRTLITLRLRRSDR